MFCIDGIVNDWDDMFFMAPLIPNLYNVDIPIKEAIVRLVRIKSIMINIYAFNVCIFFILKAVEMLLVR